MKRKQLFLEGKIGGEESRRILITLTCDGGSEFMDIEGIGRSCMDGRPRTRFYFAHPRRILGGKIPAMIFASCCGF